MKTSPIPIEQLSFTAYRLGAEESDRAAPAAFISLAQWFEAEKFRAFNRELFDEVMLAPTIIEARRFSKRQQPKWRGDWLAVRSRALACGMVYASRADTTPARWSGSSEDIAAMLAPLDLQARFLLAAAQEFIRLRDARKIAFLGAATAPPDVVGRRINVVHKRAERAWGLAHWQGRHTSWRVHDWAMSQFVPITYLGQEGTRLNAAWIERLKTAASQVVVFERRQGKTMDAAIRALRAAKVPVELDLFAADEALTLD